MCMCKLIMKEDNISPNNTMYLGVRLVLIVVNTYSYDIHFNIIKVYSNGEGDYSWLG